MKKEYIMPAVELVHLQTTSLMAGSPDMSINEDETVTSTDELLSRERSSSFWDED